VGGPNRRRSPLVSSACLFWNPTGQMLCGAVMWTMTADEICRMDATRIPPSGQGLVASSASSPAAPSVSIENDRPRQQRPCNAPALSPGGAARPATRRSVRTTDRSSGGDR
jgi:hypothetical protein